MQCWQHPLLLLTWNVRVWKCRDDDLAVVVSATDEPLDARAIKALKPAALKEKLKERDLSTQGQKKELVQRLIDYENERAI